MKIEMEVVDPKFKVNDVVLSIYYGTASISPIYYSSINLHYLINKTSADKPHWCHEVDNSIRRLIPERDLFLLSEIEESIDDIGVISTAKKLRIDVEYIKFCKTYIDREREDWEADGKSEALSS